MGERKRLVVAEATAESDAQRQDSRLMLAQYIFRARQRRASVFNSALFGEPAWDLLLDLYIARRLDGQVSVSSACIASGIPPTSALRYIASMVREGHVIRTPDPFDRRRAWLHLTDRATAAMERFLDNELRG